MNEALTEKAAHKASENDEGTDRVIDAAMKVRPTREGRLEVRLVVVTRKLEIAGKLAHDLAIIGRADGHSGQFSECEYELCAHFRHLVENTRQMLERGV